MVIFQGPNLKLKFKSLHISFTQKSRKIGCKLGKFLNSVIREVHDAKDPPIDDENEEIFFTPRESLDRLGYEIGDGSGYDCGICGEMKPVDDSFDFRGCSHFYCVDCTVKFIESKLDDKVSSIKCPEPDCEGVLDPEFCREILPWDLFNRWGNALCESAFLGSEKFYCPFRDCSALLINDGKRVIKKYRCPFCKRAVCVRCKVAWHSGLSCTKFRKLEPLGPDALFADLAKRKSWRRCPHCKNYVEKSSGCNYMKCKCGNAFCYDCGAASTSSTTHTCYNCAKWRMC